MSPLALVLALSAVFFALFLVISGGIFLYRSPGGKSAGSGSVFGSVGSGDVGVVELNGIIMDSKKTLARLERFGEDKDIRAVVLRLNSPGGAVAPSQEIYQAVKDYKKPLVVSMSSVAASGAFYIACGAKRVYANPGTLTGSIGVIMEFADLEKLYEWARIKRYAIKTGKFKDAGAEYRQMTPEERALLQGMVDDVLKQFKLAVETGRKLTPAAVTAVADGRIFSGSQAKALKLVDELGTLQDAIDEAAQLGKIRGKPNVVYPERGRHRLLDFIMDEGKEEESEAAYGGGPVSGALGSLLRNLLGPARPAADLGAGVYWLWTGAH